MRQRSEIRINATELDLQEALDLLGPVAKQCRWRLLEIEGVGDLTPMGHRMLELEQQVAAKPEGMEVSWGWLSDLAKRLKDTVNFRLVGQSASGRRVDVELFDSSYWTIRSDKQLITQLEKVLVVQ